MAKARPSMEIMEKLRFSSCLCPSRERARASSSTMLRRRSPCFGSLSMIAEAGMAMKGGLRVGAKNVGVLCLEEGFRRKGGDPDPGIARLEIALI